jgi:hypothetical protein
MQFLCQILYACRVREDKQLLSTTDRKVIDVQIIDASTLSSLAKY